MTRVEFCLFTEPQQGATYDDLLALARAGEDLGFDGFFRSDHYVAFSGDGLPGPSDAWTTLAGLARDTRTLRLGTLVSPATFREPAVLALQVAQVDQMSGGRAELGLGAGWFEGEHHAFGLPFPSTTERFDRFAEQLEIITRLWSLPVGETYSFDGTHHRLVDNRGLPKPVQDRVPVIVGGGGKARTPQLAARYATEFNTGFVTVEEAVARYERVRAACAREGRDAASLKLSYAGTTAVGSTGEEVARRAAAFDGNVDELRATGICGTPGQVVDRLGRLVEAGVRRIYVQVLDLHDLDQVALVAQQVMPALR